MKKYFIDQAEWTDWYIIPEDKKEEWESFKLDGGGDDINFQYIGRPSEVLFYLEEKTS